MIWIKDETALSETHGHERATSIANCTVSFGESAREYILIALIFAPLFCREFCDSVSWKLRRFFDLVLDKIIVQSYW